MYHNQSFFINNQNSKNIFMPTVISAFKILVDSTYFHLSDEEEFKMHPKGTIAFIRITAGNCKIYTKHGDFELKENDFIFLKFHDIIKYKATSQILGYRWVNFTFSGNCDFKLGEISSSNVNEEEEKIFSKMLAVGQTGENEDYISYFFLSYYYNICKKEKIESIITIDSAHNRQIDDICSFITQKIFTKITVDTVSAFFNISSRRLHQIFSKELGISPKQYILKKKMEEGYRLLVQTSMPINKISELLCFSSPYHFTNEFKSTFGQTPTQVRNMEIQSDKVAKPCRIIKHN